VLKKIDCNMIIDILAQVVQTQSLPQGEFTEKSFGPLVDLQRRCASRASDLRLLKFALFGLRTDFAPLEVE
jgi:hypothetical protein